MPHSSHLFVLIVVLRAHLDSLLDELLAEVGRLLRLAQVHAHVVVHFIRRVDVEQERDERRHCKQVPDGSTSSRFYKRHR